MENGQATFSRQESLQRPETGGSKFLWLLIPLILVIVVGGGFLFLRSRQASEEVTTLTPTPTYSLLPTSTPVPEETPTPIPEKTVTPTPTPKPTPVPQRVATTAGELKRQAISIQILNGSGVVGTAKKAADYLTGLFYTVSDTGNAESYDFEETVIKTKKEADLTLLKGDLETQYEIGTASATLSSTSAYDAVVIIGKK